MTALFCLLFLFMGQSLASPAANQYIDTILHTSLPDVIRREKLDPTHLPDYTFDYKDKTIFGKVHGKAEYTEGSLTGLSKLTRYLDCKGPKNSTAGTVINCTMSFGQLLTSYKGRVKYGVLPKVTIRGKGDIPTIVVNVEVIKPTGQQKPRVELKFANIGTMRTEFSGLGPLNGQMKVLENDYRGRVSSEVLNVISNRFRNALEMAAAKVPMPLR